MEERFGPTQWVYQGRTISVRVDPVRVGEMSTSREVVIRVPAVAVVAETSRSEIVVIRQYRWAVGRYLYELPAGKVDHDEDILSAAQRELKEETGYVADDWELVTALYPTPGYSDEKVSLFYSRVVAYSSPHPDSDEDIQTELWDAGKIRQFLHSSGTINGITLAGLQWWLCKA